LPAGAESSDDVGHEAATGGGATAGCPLTASDRAGRSTGRAGRSRGDGARLPGDRRV